MTQLCSFYKKIINIKNEYVEKIVSSFLVMFTWVVIGVILMHSSIDYWYEISYFIASFLLFIFAILIGGEPTLIHYILAISFWFFIMLAPFWIAEDSPTCLIQNIYALINLLLGIIMFLGKNF